ncbi:MAG: MFS transporter [Candidatus Aramenus sp.]|nr:MFS transporter [Candidatus Aramenus sp.]
MKNKNVVALSATAFFLSYFSRLAWSILSPFSSLKPTIQDDGIIFALFFVGYILVQIPAGILSDTVDYREIIFFSLLGIFASSLASGLAENMLQEFISSFVMGFSAGWIYPVTVKMISNFFKGKELAIAMGYYSLAWPLSLVLAGDLLPFVGVYLGWRWGYFLISAASAITAAYSLRIPRAIPRKSHGFTVIKNRNVMMLSLGGFLFFLSYWSIALYLYKYLLGVLENPYLSGVIYSLTALPGIISTVISGKIINALGVRKVLALLVSFYGVLIILIPLTYVALTLGIIASLMGLIRFIITPANSTAIAQIGKEKSGSVSGFVNFFWQSSGIFSSSLSALVISSIGFRYLWVIMGFVTVSSALFYALIKVQE